MDTLSLSPIPPLKNYIKNIWILNCPNSSKLEKMIPFGCMDLVYIDRESITYRGQRTKRFKKHELFLTGQVTQPYDFEFQSNTTIIGFGFYPHTAHLFTKVSAHQMTDKIFNLSDLPLLSNTLEEIEKDHSIENKIIKLQYFILREINKSTSNDQRQKYLQYMLTEIIHKQGHFEVSKFQKRLNISQRYIQFLFKEYVGISPNLYAKVIRFLNAINNYQSDSESLTELSLKLGYYDQSHFIRDFKRFTGLTPRQYFQKPPSFHEPFSKNETSSLLYNFIPVI